MGSADEPLKPQVISSSSSLGSLIDRILFPTILAGVVGGACGLVSKHRKVHGVGNMAATYATNVAIVTGCYCGAREFIRATRHSGPDDLFDSVIAGLGSGALLGRLQGGRTGAIKYSIGFALVGTSIDFAALRLKPVFKDFFKSEAGSDSNNSEKKEGRWKLPIWSPIQVLDEEALAAKREREQQLHRKIHDLSKEGS